MTLTLYRSRSGNRGLSLITNKDKTYIPFRTVDLRILCTVGQWPVLGISAENWQWYERLIPVV